MSGAERAGTPGAPGTRVRLTVAYLGGGFEGWQIQVATRDGSVPRTVQGTLASALTTLYGAAVVVQGASRTDSGVHADGQVAHFDVPAAGPSIPPEGIVRALNSRLPADLRLLFAEQAPAGWHARFFATGERYRYRIRRSGVSPPHAGLIEIPARGSLDLLPMKRAAASLTGRRDFAPFSVTGSLVRSTVRTLSRLDVEEAGPLIVVTAVGDGFLRAMVRRLVGTLLEVGRGRMAPDEARERPGPVAPARGLTLERVFYPSVLGPDV